MNKQLISIITVLVSLAIVILLAIQLYWIKNAIDLREAGFKSNVAEAVQEVSGHLEKVELTTQINKNQEFYLLRNSIDSLEAIIMADTLVKRQPNLPDLPIIYLDTIGLAEKQKLRTERVNLLNQKKDHLFNLFFRDMFKTSFAPYIENRFTARQLDSLLQFAFNKRGINAEYQMGVYSENRNLMVIEKDPAVRKRLLEKGIYYPMFTQNLSNHRDFLVLYFPDQTRYLMLQMSGMFVVSGGLILIIIISFATIIIAVFRQRKLTELKNDFINNMTHEFKTPISTVSLACEVLKDPGVTKSEELFNSYIDIIGQENKRLGALAEKVLQTAVLEKGNIRLRREKINMHDIIQGAIRTVGMQVEIRDGSIETLFRAANPFIYADKVHITNMITNLLDNANKYTAKKPFIVVSTENQRNGILISISDNGMGISKSNLKKIFEKLYRVPSGDVHDVKGFGLGLSYVKFIVDKLQGEISVESEVGKGSTFKIWLPAGY